MGSIRDKGPGPAPMASTSRSWSAYMNSPKRRFPGQLPRPAERRPGRPALHPRHNRRRGQRWQRRDRMPRPCLEPSVTDLNSSSRSLPTPVSAAGAARSLQTAMACAGRSMARGSGTGLPVRPTGAGTTRRQSRRSFRNMRSIVSPRCWIRMAHQVGGRAGPLAGNCRTGQLCGCSGPRANPAVGTFRHLADR
jgi:hypothetical protein